MNPCMQRALMFVGAVIGAGFASGREVVSFFTAYGVYSWRLILLTVAVMAGLCALCLHRAKDTAGCRWCAIYRTDTYWIRQVAEGCILLLQIIMGGSMISAAGHIVALTLPIRGAYLLGILVTIAMAWVLGGINPKPLTIISTMLAVAYVCAVFAVLVFDRGQRVALSPMPVSAGQAARGVVGAVAYGAMNLAIAIGMICRCGGCSCRSSNRSAVLFGLLMAGLMLVSNYLYLQYPALHGVTFPMVALLARFGRAGHLTSLLLMYLAIVTTLSAGLYALRTGLEERMSKTAARWLAILLPLAVSFAGFESIVDRWYTPAGLLCLLLVFGPLLENKP